MSSDPDDWWILRSALPFWETHMCQARTSKQPEDRKHPHFTRANVAMRSNSYTMIHRLLVSGERKSFTTLSFDDGNGELRKLVDFPAPYNASWVELSSSQEDRQCLIGLSEGEESGFLYTFEIDHERLKCTLTSQQATLGAPAHCKFIEPSFIIFLELIQSVITLQDQSAIALSTVR